MIQTTILKVKDLMADPDQPRKHFGADYMHSLLESMEKNGIMSPLIVEDVGQGKFLIIDGERRYRNALEMHLKEVPAVVRPSTNPRERALQRFTIQEEHAQWTPIEKAMALVQIAELYEITMREAGKAVGLNDADILRYTAFSKLINKELFIRNDMPLDFAQPIHATKNLAKRLTEEKLKETFTRSDENALERKIIHLIIKGNIVRRNDVVRLKDAFNKDPHTIRQFINDSAVTPEELFIQSKAQGAYSLRNGLQACRYAATHLARFAELRDMEIDGDALTNLRTAREAIQAVIDLAE